MFDMFWNSVQLFFKGNLFQDFNKVMMLMAVGAGLAAVLMVVLVKAGVSLWLAVMLSSLLAGAIQPRLFRDLKYR